MNAVIKNANLNKISKIMLKNGIFKLAKIALRVYNNLIIHFVPYSEGGVQFVS